jgi:sugar O-acyltransferase (sialic acid O-acetyltransferase NeuD family)
MTDLAIIGAGDFGREVALLVHQINKVQPTWNLIGFYDDNLAKGSRVFNLPTLGGVMEIKNSIGKSSLVVGISNPQLKKSIVQKLVNLDLHFPSLIYPACELGDADNAIGKGCIITAGCILTVNITIGDFVIINLATTVGHDAHLGHFTSIMPHCSISGGAKIGSECYFGTGSTILQNLSIGDRSIVGAGAVVTKSFPANAKLIGIPAANRNETN